MAVVGVLAWSVVAAGQHDARVQTGNALDANPQVGSGGTNTQVQRYEPINSQLYVTGQVTGLAGFRGRVGYAGANELRLDLPGGSVRDFQRRSIGVYDAVHGPSSYRTQAYLDRAQTALGVQGLTSGLAATGSNVPAHSTISSSVANQLYSTVTRQYRPVIDLTPRVVSTAMQPVGQVNLAPDWIRAQTAAADLDVDDRVDRPGATALFGLAWTEQRQGLLDELRDQDELGAPDARIGEALDTRVQPDTFDMSSLPTDAGEDDDESLARSLPKPGDDAFADLLMALRQRQLDAADEPDDDAEDDEDDEPNLILISALGGQHHDYFNEYMTAGDQLLRVGQYYAAAGKYRGAITINPNNPMARIGAALGLFGAGESFTAAMHLRRAMALFPPLMETRLNIPAMMDPGTFDQRLDQFKDQMEETPGMPERPGPLLLAAYLHNSVGEYAEARHYAFRLRAVAGEDEIYQAYARFVLSGKRPGEPDDPAEADASPEAEQP